MDPNETLKQLRELLGRDNTPRSVTAKLCTLADAEELFQALDEWLSKGGFLPEEWKR